MGALTMLVEEEKAKRNETLRTVIFMTILGTMVGVPEQILAATAIIKLHPVGLTMDDMMSEIKTLGMYDGEKAARQIKVIFDTVKGTENEKEKLDALRDAFIKTGKIEALAD